ncbi:hypothetical protein [Nonomuraea sp. NPDC050643]|uniref:hypothetical protein n=1 Tax=Nonomuraea sp. NPDC050643 TaxID=3155660 RepID=UPI0033F01A59
MQLARMAKVVVAAAGASLALSLPAAAISSDPVSAQEYWRGPIDSFLNLDDCTAVGRDYVRHDGAIGFWCKPWGGAYTLYVQYR